MQNVLVVYGIVLVSMIMIDLIFSYHRNKIQKTLQDQLGYLLYQYNKTIILYKDIIYDFDSTKEVLFASQKNALIVDKSYEGLTKGLLKDTYYAESLIQKTIVPESYKKILSATYITYTNITHLTEKTHIILVLITIGLWSVVKK